jgi:hypothetical protein
VGGAHRSGEKAGAVPRSVLSSLEGLGLRQRGPVCTSPLLNTGFALRGVYVGGSDNGGMDRMESNVWCKSESFRICRY